MEPTIVSSQIRAALRMLRSAIEACPEALWNREAYHNPFWVLAYHTLYFAHLYLSPSEEAFEPFVKDERTGVAVDGQLPSSPAKQGSRYSGYGRTDLGDWTDLTPDDAYTKADVLAYCDYIAGCVSELVKSTPFDEPSGFHWLKFTKGEAHLYNLRHIQHHAGQLIERLRQEAGIGSKWVFDGR